MLPNASCLWAYATVDDGTEQAKRTLSLLHSCVRVRETTHHRLPIYLLAKLATAEERPKSAWNCHISGLRWVYVSSIYSEFIPRRDALGMLRLESSLYSFLIISYATLCLDRISVFRQSQSCHPQHSPWNGVTKTEEDGGMHPKVA